jgi:CDP-glucose 4,6-dehydratase
MSRQTPMEGSKRRLDTASAEQPHSSFDPDPSYWRGRSVFLTGAQGFIGSWLSAALVDLGAEVVALVRDEPVRSRFTIDGTDRRCTLVRGDLQSMTDLLWIVNEHASDVVFHLAAQTIIGTANRAPLSTFDTNIRGTYNLLEACRLSGSVQRVVIPSTDKAYGPQVQLPYTEASPLTASRPYEVSKACADLIARSYSSTYGLPVAVTRLSNTYGGGDFNFSRLIPDTVRSLLEGKRPVLRSDASPERDFLYVEDGVLAYLAIAEGLHRDDVAGKAFNVGTGLPVPVLEVVTRLIEISGTELEPEVRGNEGPQTEIDRQCLDWSLISQTLGWAPTYALDDGLRATYDWYGQNLASLPAAPATT